MHHLKEYKIIVTCFIVAVSFVSLPFKPNGLMVLIQLSLTLLNNLMSKLCILKDSLLKVNVAVKFSLRLFVILSQRLL